MTEYRIDAVEAISAEDLIQDTEMEDISDVDIEEYGKNVPLIEDFNEEIKVKKKNKKNFHKTLKDHNPNPNLNSSSTSTSNNSKELDEAEAEAEDDASAMYELPNPEIMGRHSLAAKAQVIKQLTSEIPLNSLHLPEFIYRPDLIPNDILSDSFNSARRAEHLESAILELDYSQGYPTSDNGEPFWSQLICEPPSAYRAFAAYLDLPRSPSERLTYKELIQGKSAQKAHPLAGEYKAASVRQIQAVERVTGIPTNELLNIYHTYYWAARVRAYDLFYTAIHNKRKEQRLMEIENSHFDMATEYLGIAQSLLNQVLCSPEEWGLKPKEILDLVKMMVQIQRISVGTTNFGSSGASTQQNSIPQNASLEVILKTLAMQTGAPSSAVVDKEANVVNDLLKDPIALQQAQELIIRMNTLAQPRGNAMKTIENEPLESNQPPVECR